MSAKLAIDHDGYLIRDRKNVVATSAEGYANKENIDEQAHVQLMKDLLEQREKDFVFL